MLLYFMYFYILLIGDKQLLQQISHIYIASMGVFGYNENGMAFEAKCLRPRLHYKAFTEEQKMLVSN